MNGDVEQRLGLGDEQWDAPMTRQMPYGLFHAPVLLVALEFAVACVHRTSDKVKSILIVTAEIHPGDLV
jgi:hypothetical protein